MFGHFGQKNARSWVAPAAQSGILLESDIWPTSDSPA